MNKETISEYYLERYALGELPVEDKEEINRLAASAPEIQSSLAEIKSSNEEILFLYPPLTVKAGLLARLEEVPRKTFSIKRIFAASAAVAAFLIIFLMFPLLKKEPRIISPDPGQDITLIKGIPAVDLTQTQLLVYRKKQDRVEILSDGQHASAGDLLQLAYVATRDPYGMILSIDGRGTVTLHLPESLEKSTELERGKQFLLPNAIELDDAPGFERFFFLTSDTPIDVEGILQDAQDLAKNLEKALRQDMDVPESYTQYSVLILKGEGV
jgi:hypothetical protein